MPKFVRSGKYYYKVNERSGKKTRISKDEYIKYNPSKSRKRIVKIPRKSRIPVKKTPDPEVINAHSSNSLEEILHEEIRKKLKKVGEEKLTKAMVNIEKDVIVNGKKYKVYAKVRKCPRSNYYMYKIIAKHMSNNRNYQTVYQRSLVSSDPILF